MTSQSVPRLDLAPKLQRHLCLWNPFDYLRLLYWVFFFPQAIRWYVERFGDPAYVGASGRTKVRESLQHDPMQRRLVVQEVLVLIAANAVLVLVVQGIGIPLSLAKATGGVALSVVVGVAVSVVWGVAVGVAWGVAVGVAWGVAVGVAWGVLLDMDIGAAAGVMRSIVVGIIVGASLGLAVGVAWGVAGGVARSVARTLPRGVTFGVAAGVVVGTVVGAAENVVATITMGLAMGVTLGLASPRPLDWCLAWPVFRITGFRSLGSHVTWLPIPGLHNILAAWLRLDWDIGVHNLNQLLAFSLQFVPVVRAVEDTLAITPPELVLPRVASLVEQPYDWDLIRFCSANLNNRLIERAADAFFVLPKSWQGRIRARYPSPLRVDTPTHAACAGFWLWHVKSIDEACDALARVTGVRHGFELFNTAQAFVNSRPINSLEDMAAIEHKLNWLDTLPDPELRPGTLAVLRRLRAVAGEARVAHQAVAPLNHSTALGRANAVLTELIETLNNSCPYPEWPIVQEIATRWRDILIKAGGVLGEEVLRQPVMNPYEGYSGLPVIGVAFVGRRDLLRQIETCWASTGHVPPLILYGHRRMGKTSILKQMGGRTDQRSILVYLNMQNSGWVDNTGDLLLDLAEAIHTSVQQAGLDAGPTPIRSDYAQFGDARYALNHLLQQLAPQMIERRLVLAIDEFEVIQDGLDTRRIDAGLLPYLRALGQEHPWLAFMFAGLHTLDEMGHDYRSAFYGQAEHLRVGYLSRADAIDLITRPHPDFALEYEPALREELYRLTYGQPYLLQRLCWELVNRWNERFLVEGKETPRTLMVDDLTPLLTPDFYHAAGYYFDGVWSNITEAERHLLRRMAARAEGEWTIDELAALMGQSATSLQPVVKLLRQHDVIAGDGAGLRFASELMRRWVVDIAPTLPIEPADTGPGEC